MLLINGRLLYNEFHENMSLNAYRVMSVIEAEDGQLDGQLLCFFRTLEIVDNDN
jgi:hypothetical protein